MTVYGITDADRILKVNSAVVKKLTEDEVFVNLLTYSVTL
jgi:hypothetical protein